MALLKDLSGKKSNMLTAISFIERRNNKSYWLCRCDCGNDTIVDAGNFTSKHTKSCGCLSLVFTKRLSYHGMTNTRLYTIHNNMLRRCYCNKSNGFKNYGGRGVTVCDEWKSDFISFYNWAMETGYSDSLTLDRKNNDGNYCPENCKWATKKEQSLNNRKTKVYKMNGLNLTLQDISNITGIPRGSLYHRTQIMGLDIDDAIFYNKLAVLNQ